MGNALNELRQALHNPAVTAIDRAHVEVLFSQYDQLMNRVLELGRCAEEPGRTNTLDILASVVARARELEARHPRRVATQDTVATREYLDHALQALAANDEKRAVACIRLAQQRVG